VGKIPKSPKQLLVERFLRVKPSIQKKILLPHQPERNLNTGILNILVPGLPVGRALYVQRAQEDGHDIEDWLEAEHQILPKEISEKL
jgi:hypothetical protein